MGSGISWEWIVFALFVGLFLSVDIFLHRGQHGGNQKWAIIWSIAAISCGLGFCGFVWWDLGAGPAQEYLAAYLLEESLSLDNLFVFLIIFRMLSIPVAQQGVALVWGILGALVLRGIFIFLGAEVLHRWAWVEYILAALLLAAAWRAFRAKEPDQEGDNQLVRWLSNHLPVSGRRSDTRFLVREAGRLKATPLLVAVIALELSDVMFAIDSVPAVFSITHETFIVYTSNVFAILGLRSLYVVVAHTIAGLRYLHYGLAVVLAFAAVKMVLGHWQIEIPPLAAVAITVLTIGTAVLASMWARRLSRSAPEDASRVEVGQGQE